MENQINRMYYENFTANLFFQNELYLDVLSKTIEWKVLNEKIILENKEEIKKYVDTEFSEIETINIDEAIIQGNRVVVNGEFFLKENKLLYFCNIYSLEKNNQKLINKITTFIN